MEARVVWESVHDDAQMVVLNGHEIQFGGYGGDGFCYSHQSFSCLDHLTEEERAALRAV